MLYSTKMINANYRIKVSGIDNEGNHVHKLVGVSGAIALIGENFLMKFVSRAENAMQDVCVCKLRRGLKVSLYKKKKNITFMIITYRGTEITMERTMSYGHYRINQFDCHGRRIFSSIVTDSMTYDDYTSLKGEWFNSGRQRDAMLQRVRALLRREKETRW